MIKILKLIILGIIQGLIEPLPISSSGHILIFKKLFNIKLNDLNFEIIINFGSFLAITYLYRKKIFNIIVDSFKFIKTKNNKYKNNFNYFILIIIGTLPAGIIGLFLKDKIDKLSNNIKLIGIALIITSITLFLINDIKGKKERKDITIKDSIKIGLFQALALFPGISRSGSTITGAVLCNIKKEVAVDYSFMLYLPISMASFIISVKDLFIKNNNTLLKYFIPMIISSIFTFYSAKWFINIIKKEKLTYFSLYCLIIGILIIIFL